MVNEPSVFEPLKLYCISQKEAGAFNRTGVFIGINMVIPNEDMYLASIDSVV